MVKFNLQKHLEQFHTMEERNTSAGEIIKVDLESVLKIYRECRKDRIRNSAPELDADPDSGIFVTKIGDKI